MLSGFQGKETLFDYEQAWLAQDFFRLYPLHFYENSFQFVHNIPREEAQDKELKIIWQVGGIHGCSSLARGSVESVSYYDARAGVSVGSRYKMPPGDT
jgi:hypothetical protein